MLRKLLFMLLILSVLSMYDISAYASPKDENNASLSGWFGITDGSDIVQEIDLPSITHHGIEMSLKEVLIDEDQVHLLLSVNSDKITSLNSLQITPDQNDLGIGDHFYEEENRFRIDYQPFFDRDSPSSYTLERDGSIQLVLTAEVPESLLEGDEVKMRLAITKVDFCAEKEPMGVAYYGPWSFIFKADLRPVKRMTRTIELDHAFIGGGNLYEAVKLVTSPICSRIYVRRLIPNRHLESDLYKKDTCRFLDEMNLLGFTITDGKGNRIEIDNYEYPFLDFFNYVYEEAPRETADLTFISDRGKNGWKWVKDAETLTITPFISTLSGPINEGNGLERYTALDPVTVDTGTESLQSSLEAFMTNYEPDYIDHMIDTSNAYVKPIRMMQITESGAVLMLDKVLVTENSLYASILIGVQPVGDNPQIPSSFSLEGKNMTLSPHIPYPENYFDPTGGGGGGGGAYINLLNENPLVVFDGIGSPLMFEKDYVSAKDTIHVKVDIYEYSVCWDDSSESPFDKIRCFNEKGPWAFEFETDGAELSEKTIEIEPAKTVQVENYDLTLKRLRFNPMHIILFTNNFYHNDNYASEQVVAYVEADDGTKLILNPQRYPFQGYSRRIINPDVIAAMDQTEKLKIKFCLIPYEKRYEAEYTDIENTEILLSSYRCDPTWYAEIELKQDIIP